MRLIVRFVASLAALVSCLVAAQAQDQFDPFGGGGNSITQSALLSDTSSIAPGTPFTVALKLTHEDGWHSYYHNDGIGISKIPELNWTLPEGFEAGPIEWPIPHAATFVGMTTYGYEGTNYLFTTITPPASLQPGQEVIITLEASWQTCKESCIDEQATHDLRLPVAESAQPDTAVRAELDTYREAHTHVPTPDDWTVTASETDGQITLTLTTGADLPSGLTFFEFDKQVDAQAAQEWSSPENGTWSLTVPRNKGNDFSDPGPVLEIIRGILAGEDALPGADAHGVWIEIPLAGSGTNAGVDSASDSGSKGHLTAPPDTPEVLAEMASLYDPEEKIDYRTLDTAGKSNTTFWTALLGAFIGGMILNLMPCVFPVLGIKVMGFVEQAGSDKGKVRLHGMAFTAGLVASMWVLAGVLLFIKLALGQDVNWGQQMGNPYFVAAIIVLLFVLGLNLAGVYEMGLFLTGTGSGLQRKKGYQGSFFSGILTTLIATPCSGPFLGAAMGYTMAQPALVALFLFTIFALGIASPYLILSFFPALIAKLPRPGPWMETFKKSLSFAMFATAAFFLQTFGRQTGVKGMSWLLMALVVLGLALFFYGHYSPRHRKASTRRLFGFAMPAGIAAIGIWMAAVAIRTEAPASTGAHVGGLVWEDWQPGKVEFRRKKGRIVWVDYTADW